MLRQLLVTVVLATAATGCAAALNVSSHRAATAEWPRYRTFEWATPDALPAVDPRLDANLVFRDRMHGAVVSMLLDRGWEEAAGTPADVQIHYHANVTARLDVGSIDAAYGSCPGGACPEPTVEYQVGTLILDFIDARTQRLIWRGWAETKLHELLRDPDRMTDTVNRAVTRMLAQLPAAGSSRSTP